MSGADFVDSKERKQIMKPRKDKNDKKDRDMAAIAHLDFPSARLPVN